MEYRYTFSTIGVDGTRRYPKNFLWEQPGIIGAGLCDFSWTTNVCKAHTWPEQEQVETIAFEYPEAEIIEVIGDMSRVYKIVKRLE